MYKSLYEKGLPKKKSKFADCLRIIGQERECVVLFIGTPSLTLQIVTQMPRMGLSGSSTCWSCLSCCPGGQEETGKATRLQTQTKNADYRADTAGGAESMTICLLLFDGKRLLTLALFTLAFISSLMFTYNMTDMIDDNSNFLLFGPNKINKLLGVHLDSWFKWWVTVVYTFVSTAIAAFAGDSLLPIINNTIQDHKSEFIPFSMITCLCIIQVFTV